MLQRRQRCVRAAVGAAVVAVALAGCSSGAKTASSPSTAAGEPTTVADPAAGPPITATATTDAIKAQLVDPGPGFSAVAESAAGAGPIDLARAARDSPSGQPGPLSQAGFLGGYQDRWQHTDGRQLLVSVYEFSDPAGAAAVLAATTSNPGFQASPHFTVGAVPGAQGTVTTGAGVAAVTFASGPYLVNVVAFASTDADGEALASTVAQAQYAGLRP
jgi:hypothetical protein